jgi:hypothetical protein
MELLGRAGKCGSTQVTVQNSGETPPKTANNEPSSMLPASMTQPLGARGCRLGGEGAAI